jgi:hypothetical protein
MFRLHKVLFPALLVGLLIIGFSKPVTGQLGPPKLSVEPFSITTDVSTEFSIGISITDIPVGNRLEGLYIEVTWLRAAMERVGEDINTPAGWAVQVQESPPAMPPPPEDWMSFEFAPTNGILVNEDRRWVTITFHCLETGTTTILVEGWAIMSTAAAGPQRFDLLPDSVIVNQGVAPVGGVAYSVNKLEILTPYIALAGLIIAVSTVYVIKKRKD